MLKIILIVVAVLLGSLLVFAATKPDSFRVQRETRIQAPPEKIFALIDDFHSWGSWSPYEKLDPTMKKTLGGPAKGKGSVYEWEGNGKVGKGRMEITDVSPPAKVTIQLDFVKPFEGHNVAEFTLAGEGGATKVTWAMQGRSPYIAKLMSVFFDMDQMIGKDFESGLANLKRIVET